MNSYNDKDLLMSRDTCNKKDRLVDCYLSGSGYNFRR